VATDLIPPFAEDAFRRVLGIASLEAHAQYLAGIPGHPAPRIMVTGITAWHGRAMGVPNAVLFRAFDFQAPPPIAAEIMAAAQDG